MRRRTQLLILRKFSWMALGAMWISGCGVSDIQLRDFAISTGVRVFFQTLGTAFQSAFVNAFGTG